ncbi:hypothetical protein C8Q79DRAFT_919741 [Trametes meyenii]|nr:hypothetical protein C8Q79DRAFT_919741 [Trametes meyenii]
MRNMPTFRRDRIRKFWNDVAAQKNLAARDYEDFLVCIMPAFEGLLPLQDDETCADLLFELANWHALAKLRLHTEVTLEIFEGATRHMYEGMRVFATTTCKHHVTHELAKEAETRIRPNAQGATSARSKSQKKRRLVRFNTPSMIKYHQLCHYPRFIRRSGTTDNYTTQIVSILH